MLSALTLDEALKNVSVVGAAGKMGSGISLLMLQEMARSEAQLTGNIGSGNYRLNLIDSNAEGLFALRKYLLGQLTKYAEKNIIALRSYFMANSRLISNEEIIKAFVEGAFNIARFESELKHAKDSLLVFEAIVEDIPTKVQTLSSIRALTPQKIYYFSNTSSIPIKELNRQASLHNCIIGFHFYNPPAIQKLLEVIAPEQIDPNLKLLALELAQRLQKKIVFSKDIAGFIGNGHFIREIKFACNTFRQLLKSYPDMTSSEAIYLINHITQVYLLRPMGIFQLIDYVGIDVCQKIAAIMTTYLPGNDFQDDLIDQMLRLEVRGGQNSDGSQKNGFFQYERLNLKGIYGLKEKKYFLLSDPLWQVTAQKFLKTSPQIQISWKDQQNAPLQNASLKEQQIKEHFAAILKDNSFASQLAESFLLNSREIALNLVTEGIAEKIEDVNTALENGFFHLYGANPAWLETENL